MWRITTNKDWAALEQQFDWVADMADVPQDPIFHAEGNVAIHTQMVIEELLKLDEYAALDEQTQEVLFAAALLHDVEKRSTTEISEAGRITSPRHAKKGEFTARHILYKDVVTPFDIREQIAKLVRYHGFPIWVLKKRDPLKNLIRCSWEVDTSLLYLLAKADIKGRIATDDNDFLERVEFFKEYCIEQDCWGKPKEFENDLARFMYFHKEDAYPDYVPFDDMPFEVIMMCGLPGVGKDTFIAKHYADLPVVSLDDIRKEFKISPKDSKAQGKVAHIARDRMKVFLRKKQSFILNATNITSDLRAKNINLFSTYKAKTRIIYLEVPYKTLFKQNHKREDSVPLNVIGRMMRKLDMPSLTESYDVEYYRDGKLLEL
jgi:predicted kinase